MERESGVSEFWKILRDLSEDERQELKRVTFVFAPAYIRESGENPEFMKVRKRSYGDLTPRSRGCDISGRFSTSVYLHFVVFPTARRGKNRKGAT